MYHKLDLEHEVDAQRKALLKVPGADDKNNAQNFFRYVERTSVEAKATMMDLLPAVHLRPCPPNARATCLTNFSTRLGSLLLALVPAMPTLAHDLLLHNHNKETSEAFCAVISLGENATIDQLRDAYREVQEAKASQRRFWNTLNR
ncbi:hypothetical protein P4S64_18820 [Vibrio sp. M60_M31a]